MKCTSSILLSLKGNALFGKSTSNILPSLNVHIHKLRNYTSSMYQSFKISTSILKVCFQYISEFEDKYMSLESSLQVYF